MLENSSRKGTYEHFNNFGLSVIFRINREKLESFLLFFNDHSAK